MPIAEPLKNHKAKGQICKRWSTISYIGTYEYLRVYTLSLFSYYRQFKTIKLGIVFGATGFLCFFFGIMKSCKISFPMYFRTSGNVKLERKPPREGTQECPI